eukprot:jgi/Undpi1/11180/HiC_scaffold_30.g13478.m1
MSSRPTSAHAGVSSTAAAPVAASKAAAAVPESGGGSEENSFFERKMAFRKQIKLQLKAMSQSAVDTASSAVAARLLASSQLAEDTSSSGGSSGGGAVSIYLAMPGELNTQAIVSELFKRGKKVYIPKVLGPRSADMRMFPLRSEEEVDSFPLTKWKIPEPSEELVLSREDGVLAGDIDVVVVPAMAFDAGCNRLGHGRGYYDSFFERVNKANAEKGRPPPVKMGVCFDEQVVDCVPTTATDVRLDFVFTPSRTFTRDDDDGNGGGS